MQKPLMILLILCGLFPLSLAWADAERGIGIRRIEDLTHANRSVGAYRALIIGIDDYRDEKIPKLDTAVADATAMAELLRDRYGFQFDGEKDLLLNSKATLSAIYNALRKLATSAGPSDSVLIYYAGHGDLDKVFNAGWWIPADAVAGDPSTYLANGQVQMAMDSMRAQHVLLISDSCYSGTLFGNSREIPPVITNKYYLGLFNEKSRWGMTSGNKTPVADSGTAGHSIFAYQLLKALRNNEKSYLSAQQLYTDIAPIIGNNSDQVPLCKPIKHAGDQGGQFIFIASSVDAPISQASRAQTLLSVSANVSDAKVYLDGRYMGNTPFFKVEITPGSHRVRVTKAGYYSYTKEITVNKGWTKSFQAFLDQTAPLKGRLNVHAVPENATIKILNIAPKFTQGMELSPGDYHLEVSTPGYTRHKTWLTLSAGEDKDLDIRLKPVARASTTASSVAKINVLSTRQDQRIDTASASPDASPQEKVKNSLGMEFVYISPGSFMMGSPEGEKNRNDDEAQHKVTLTKGFYMQTTEVTQGQWQAVMGNNPSRFKSCGENCPVEQVSWNDVQGFIRQLNQRESGTKYRLPTEAEWEYAARADSNSRFCFGDSDETLNRYAWFRDNFGGNTHPVAQKQPNDWGLYDMHGNVYEWCQDWEGSYPTDSITNPQGPSSGDGRVLRGGCWLSLTGGCRSAFRYRSSPGHRNGLSGFRLVAPCESH